MRWRWLWTLTGGRPMRRKHTLFVDVVSGKSVVLYHDKFGRPWMVDGGAWSLFRVPLLGAD